MFDDETVRDLCKGYYSQMTIVPWYMVSNNDDDRLKLQKACISHQIFYNIKVTKEELCTN